MVDDRVLAVGVGIAAMAAAWLVSRSGDAQRIVDVEEVGSTQLTTTSPSPSPGLVDQALDRYNEVVDAEDIEANLESQYGDLGEIV